MRSFSVLAIAVVVVSLGFADPQESVQIRLKMRQPNWRNEVVSAYPTGTPRQVLFYEPLLEGGERPVKEIDFYENGAIQTEVDLTLGDEGRVFHGARIDINEEGKLLQTAHYQLGQLEGQVQQWYPNGKVKSTAQYVNGQLDGKAQVFFEDGQLKEEATYVRGKMEGDCVQYFESGSKMRMCSYLQGEPHGVSYEWYDTGVLKLQRQFVQGFLHGDGATPAILVYNAEQVLVEAADFRQGVRSGLHVGYHKNGQESYRVLYKGGKKEGKEQFFGEDGALIGEGMFTDGKALGTHWKDYPDGTMARRAYFDKKGTLLEPVCEYDMSGAKLREYSLVDDKLDGAFTEWYPNGNLKAEFHYQIGEFEGEQKEYYESGQMKVSSYYKDHRRNGVHQEWYESGILAKRIGFFDGLKEGQLGEWYENGNRKLEAWFQNDLADGPRTSWYENGTLQVRLEFVRGMKQGWERNWNERGALVFEGFFDQNQPDGAVLTWWDQDVLRTRFHVNKGHKEGKQEWFDSNGHLEKVASYKGDQLDGQVMGWFLDGSVALSQCYVDGKRVGEELVYQWKGEGEKPLLVRSNHYDDGGNLHGEQKNYYANGTLQMEVCYIHGAMDGCKRAWNEQGELIEEAHYAQGKLDGSLWMRMGDKREVVFAYRNHFKNGPHTLFYPPNGQGEKVMAFTASFRDDQLDGMACEYDELGVKRTETTFVLGEKEGVAKEYAPNGKLVRVISFQKNVKNGIEIEYFPNGVVHREICYVDDHKEENEKTYYENGSLASLVHYHGGCLDGLSQNWSKTGVLIFEAEYQDGQRHGKFIKNYDDGKPYIEQVFAYDEPVGVKKKFDREGKMITSK